MPGALTAAKVLRFDDFEVDLAAGLLHKGRVRISLREQSFQVLASLLEHPGQVVTREELRRRLWPDDVFVDFDNNLNSAIARLREALCDSAEHPRFIETLPKHGYRFIANVFEVPPPPDTSPGGRVRVVVLPFVNLSGDPAEEYFSDAMTDEVITQLAALAPELLAVIARTTAMHYKGSHKDVTRIGRELGVDYVVEGGALRWNNQLRVNVQLIRASDQLHLFARKYDVEMRDVFSLHADIVHEIAKFIPTTVEKIDHTLILGKHVRRTPTKDLTAYNDYIKGRYESWRMTAESGAKTRQHFEAAIARDPEFALAYCGLAQLYWYLGLWGYAPSRETDPVGRFYALRAIEIDPALAEGYALLSYYPKQRHYNEPLCYYDWRASLNDVLRARELNPASQLMQLRYAIVLMVLGRTEEAAAELEHALENDPLSIEVRTWLAEILYVGRQNERALEQVLRVVELEPEHFAVPYHVLGYIYLTMQKYEESVTAARKAVQVSGELPHMLGGLGLALGLGGHTSEARWVLEHLHALAQQRHVPPTCFAWTHIGLGEIDEAFVWLDRAVDAPDRMLSPIKTYPFLDPIRSDPRFAALLRKMNLEP
jgi:TolB-like protein/tetratricopeptide (TPR) repeat protein